MAEDISKMCLLCRSNTDVDGISLLDPSKKITMEEISVLFNLKICSKNGLPTKICLQCYNRVIDFMALQYVCSMSYEYFCDYLKRFQSNDEHSDVSGTLNDKSGTPNDKYGTLSDKSGTLISDKSAVTEPDETSICSSPSVALTPSLTCINTQIVSPPELKELQIIVNRNEVKKYLEKQQEETPNIKIKIENDIDDNDYKEKFAAVQQIYVHDSQDHHEELESVKSEVNSPLNDNAEGELELKPTIRVEDMDWTFLDENGTIYISAVDFAFIKSEISTIQPIPVEQCEDKHSDKIQTYFCHLCEKKCKGLLLFKQHLTKTHHLSNEEVLKYVPEFYECKYCHRQFKNSSRLHTHEGSHTLPFKCDICYKRFGQKCTLQQHKLIHSEPQLSCPHCDIKFRLITFLKRHIKRTHNGSVHDEYACDQCEKKFKCKGNLRIHIKHVHAPSSEKSWKCDECGNCFKFKEYLIRHKLNVHSGFRYSCIHCGVKFKQSKHLKGHIETQHSGGVRKYKCDHCEKRFKSKDTIRLHMKCVHTVASENSWKCDVCGKCFKCREYLNDHKRNFHIQAKLCCDHCGKKFKQKSNLNTHISINHSGGVRNYECDRCDKKFKSKRYLQFHIKCVHAVASVKSWKCDECSKCFKCKEYLRDHKKNVHSGSRYSCIHCGVKFKQSAHLKGHIETQHSGGVRKYECDQCKKRFLSKYSLKMHIKCHHASSSKNSWKCDECGKCFICIEYLKHHKRNVHSGLKFCCIHCGRKFKLNANLKRHLNTQHN